jgi:hypothetical protein
MTNANQGVLTFLALAVAGLAVWVEVLARQASQNRTMRAQREAADAALAAAAGEAHHNLIHIALTYQGGQVLQAPPHGLSVDASQALLRDDIRPLIAPAVLGELDALRRTFDTVCEMLEVALQATRRRDIRRVRRLIQSEPPPYRGFVTTSFGLLMGCYRYHRDPCAQIFREPGLQDADRILQAADHARGLFRFFRTSEPEAQQAAPAIRTNRTPVVCWFDDTPLGPAVPTFALGPQFADASVLHTHSG